MRVQGLSGSGNRTTTFQDLVVGCEDGRGQRKREVGRRGNLAIKIKNKREKRLWAYETVGNLDFL